MDTVKTYQQLSNIELNSTKVIRLVVKTSGVSSQDPLMADMSKRSNNYFFALLQFNF